MTKICAAVLAALVLGLAGCGDDDEDTSTSGGGGGGAATESNGGGGGSTPALSDDAKKQAVENCQKAVDASPQLSADVKSDLVEICKKAADGDEEAVKKATKEVCVKIVEETVPAGAARTRRSTPATPPRSRAKVARGGAVSGPPSRPRPHLLSWTPWTSPP